MKKIKVKKLFYKSNLGSNYFSDVSVWVDDSISDRNFDEKEHEYSLDDEEASRLSRELAHKFIIKKINNNDFELTDDEVYGVRLVLGINSTEFASIIGIHKGTMSKILKGTIKMKKPECMLAMIWLIKELAHPQGYIKDPNKYKNRKEDEIFNTLLKHLSSAA